jgi:hypothetical protein
VTETVTATAAETATERRAPRWGVRASLALALLICASLASRAAADVITLGVFAPAAHFANTQRRLELGQLLADHLDRALPDTQVRSRVYARATDFEEAVRLGVLGLALVDATYLVKTKLPYRVIAAAPEVEWRLVSGRHFSALAELKGKRLRLATGGDEKAVAQGLFGGEAEAFFGAGSDGIAATQDSASALAALSLGKADAALLPVNLPLLGEDIATLVFFEKMPGVVLVAFPEVLDPPRARIAAAVADFRGEEPVLSLQPATDEVVAKVRQRLAVTPRRAPMPTLPLRALIDSLVNPLRLSIPQRPAQEFAQLPDGKPALPPKAAPAAPAGPR